MITRFWHKGLRALFESGSARGIQPAHAERLRLILARLNASQSPQDVNLPGLGLHKLRGRRAGHFAVSVSGNWRVTSRFDGQDAVDVDYLDYH